MPTRTTTSAHTLRARPRTDPAAPRSLDATASALVVRETRTEAEREALYRATARVFRRVEEGNPASLAAATSRWKNQIEGDAACFPVYKRAAFDGDTFVGSYTIYERQLRLGPH